jgi:hypothetical protein
VSSPIFSARRGRATALFALVLGISLAPLPGSAGSKTPVVRASQQTGHPVSLWLNPVKQTVRAEETRRQRILARSMDSRHGRGSYICSASGFGQRSSCFSR